MRSNGSPGAGGGSGVAGAIDPNEKFGAGGYGTNAYIQANSLIPYRINFENSGPGSVPTPTQIATAPAQQVVVTDQLSDKLDWGTFQFTEFGFGDTVVGIPVGRQHAFQSVAMTYNGTSFTVEVELDFDAATGMVRVVFQSVDPLTQLPPDVLTGFLPPEDGTGRGQGHIGYSVRMMAGLPTGTQIRNVADIVFDGQPAIATNQIDPHNAAAGTSPNKEALNTVDAGLPTSRISALPATSAAPLTVSWSGTDDAGGSGVAFYDVYVSTNGGAYTVWQSRTTGTSAEFSGALGSTYRFYSLATDHVGLTQDQATSVVVQTLVTSILTPPVTFLPEIVAVGSSYGSTVRVYDVSSGALIASFDAFPGFDGGINVATADVTGDGVLDVIVGTGPGGGPHVKVFDGTKLSQGPDAALMASFYAFDLGFLGGVTVAAADLNGDGRAEVIVGAGPGAGPHVKVFNGASFELLASFFAYDQEFQGGVNVTAGDFDGDGRFDLITGAGAGSGPHVIVFDGRSFVQKASFYAFDFQFLGGVRVAAGDFDGDGRADVIVGAGQGGQSHVSVFAGETLTPMASFFAFDFGIEDGVDVAYHRRNERSPLLYVGASSGKLGIRVFAPPMFDRVHDTFEDGFLGGVNVG